MRDRNNRVRVPPSRCGFRHYGIVARGNETARLNALARTSFYRSSVLFAFVRYVTHRTRHRTKGHAV